MRDSHSARGAAWGEPLRIPGLQVWRLFLGAFALFGDFYRVWRLERAPAAPSAARKSRQTGLRGCARGRAPKRGLPRARTMVDRRPFHVRTARRSRKMCVPFGRAEPRVHRPSTWRNEPGTQAAGGLPAAAWRRWRCSRPGRPGSPGNPSSPGGGGGGGRLSLSLQRCVHALARLHHRQRLMVGLLARVGW